MFAVAGLLWLDCPMPRNRKWLWIAFVACLCSVGFPFWTIPYQKVNLPDTFYGHPMFAVGLAAFLLYLFRIAGFWRVVLAMGAVMPTAVLLRVQVEVAKDPTSHNLWPLEIMIAGVLGLICALVGTVVGRLAAPLLGSRRAIDAAQDTTQATANDRVKENTRGDNYSAPVSIAAGRAYAQRKETARNPEETLLNRWSGVTIIRTGLIVGAAGMLPLLVYILVGPKDGNPIGLGLLAMATVPLAGMTLVVGFVKFCVERSRGLQ
jgi:hypothetical protein